MQFRRAQKTYALLLPLLAFAAALVPRAQATACLTQAQMAAMQRDALSNAARNLMTEVQTGNEQGLQTNTIPAVAADFGGIRSSAEYLKPLVQQATVTIDALYVLDASSDAAGAARTDFYCGSPVVVLNFTNLPPATYALAILHATGVPQPQQVSLILSKVAGDRWMLAGFFSKPMIAAGHDGLWYWTSARKYAQQTKMSWGAWFYFRMANNLLDPLDFLSSSNLEKLQHESDQVKPDNLPGTQPLKLALPDGAFAVTAIDTTTTFGALDLDVHYTPDAVQAAQLRDPPSARKQVTGIMAALLELHPELQSAFHGIWVHADQGNASLFALELPMNQIAATPPPHVSSSVAR
jgi:hypothetical protein